MKTRNVLLRVLVFADESAFVEYNHPDAEEITTRFLKSAKAFGQKISLKKTNVIYHPTPGCCRGLITFRSFR